MMTALGEKGYMKYTVSRGKLKNGKKESVWKEFYLFEMLQILLNIVAQTLYCGYFFVVVVYI